MALEEGGPAPDGTVAKRWRRVAKAADHPAKVLEALEKLPAA